MGGMRLPANRKIVLLLGGARSGKSSYAQEIATTLGEDVLFIATGQPLDEEMKERINQHKRNRPKGWKTIESTNHIGRVMKEHEGNTRTIIIDCITLLVSNLLGDEPDYFVAENRIIEEVNELDSAMKASRANVIIVSNEVGLGLVPDNKLGRIYRDLLGKANQLLAKSADEVYFMAAGIPIKIK
jgi:adenosylcobinamide kinase/adenosylcobinamide-phosphate guanylyltransferase